MTRSISDKNDGRRICRRYASQIITGVICLFLGLPAASTRANLEQAAPPESVLPTTTVYTLAEALKAARNNAFRLQPWQFTRQRAAGRVALARTELAPTIRLRARLVVLSNRDALGSSDEPSGFGRERARVSLSASHPVYDAGRRNAQVRAAQAELRGTEEAARGAEVELLQDVTDTFFRVLRRQRLTESGNLRRAAAQELLRGAQARYDLGNIAKGEVLAAQSAVSSATADALQRGADLAAARAQLANLMGLDPITTAPAAAGLTSVSESPGSLEHLVERAMAASPEQARLVTEREAARARLAAARAERSPAVTARANVGYVLGDDSGTSGARNQPFARVSVGVDFPLFEGPALRAREQSLTAEVQLQETALLRLENDIKEEVVVAFSAYQASAPKFAAAQDAVRTAEEAQRLAQERYKVGRGTQLEVLRSLDALATAHDQYTEARNDQEAGAQNLRFLVGIDLPGPASVPVSGALPVARSLEAAAHHRPSAPTALAAGKMGKPAASSERSDNPANAARAAFGETPLHRDGAARLIAAGADLNAKDHSGRTPLSRATFRGNARVAITDRSADPPARDNKLRNPGDGMININTAGSAELQRLVRCGPAMAERIIAYRREIGRFTSVEQLQDVKGVGEKTFARWQPFVTVR